METQLKKPSTNSVGNWTPEEDEAILRYVYEKGKGDEHMMWGNLSETLNGRSGKSCRERWFNHLDPKIKRTEWSQEEQWVLFILRNQSSEKWSLISKKLMGRTDNAVKNYWNSRLKKRIDSMQHAVNQHFERKKKQKIMQMTQSNNSNGDQVSANNGDQQSVDPLNLSKEQTAELEQYMERIKSEYLQKILDQVNHQNTEYFENLACEYTLQLQLLQSGQKVPEPIQLDKSKGELGVADFILGEGTAKGLHEQISFMSKPDLIQMHLNILYKSVNFLSNDRILSILQDYKKTKDEKRKEEEKRALMQMMMKKTRGRHSAKKDKLTDDEMADKSKNDIRSKNGDDMSKDDEVNSTSHDQNKDRKLKKNVTDQNMIESIKKDSPESPENIQSNCKADNQDALMTEKPQHASSMISNESSYSGSSDSGISERQSCSKLRKFKKSSALRKILKNLKKQKKQSRLIEKIFVSQKKQRTENEVAEDPFLIKPAPQICIETQSNANSENIKQTQSTNDKSKCAKKPQELKISPNLKIQAKIKKIESEGVLTRHQQQNALILKKKSISKDLSGKIVSKSKISFAKKLLNKLGKKKFMKKEGETSQVKPQTTCMNQDNIPQGLTPDFDNDMHKYPYMNPQMDQGYEGCPPQFDMHGHPLNSFPHITNNITNNNNYYSQNYNITYNNVQNVTQNFYINYDDEAPNGGVDPNQFVPQQNSSDQFQPQDPQFNYMNQNCNFNGFQQADQQPIPNDIIDYVIDKNPSMMQNETSNPYRGQSPDAFSAKRRGGRVSSHSRSHSRKRSTSAKSKNGQRLKTTNFFNQTMTQIVQGKDRELFPLVDKKKIQSSAFAMEQPNLMNQKTMLPPSETYFNNFETPQKPMMAAQKQFYDIAEDQSTQMCTPFIKQNQDIGQVTPFNQNIMNSPSFGLNMNDKNVQQARFMTPQFNLEQGQNPQINGLQRFQSYSEPPKQFIDQPKLHKMNSCMSFNNIVNTETPQSSVEQQSQQYPVPHVSAYRLPATSGNDFSADIVRMKVDGASKNPSQVIDKRLFQDMKEHNNDLSVGTVCAGESFRV